MIPRNFFWGVKSSVRVGGGGWVRLQKVDCLSIGVFGGGVGLQTSLRGVIGLRVPECM